MNTSEHYDNLKRQINHYIRQYGEQVHPRLKLIHTDASTESICTNVTNFVREAQEQGVEVGAVFVDYMQLLSTDNKHFSRHDELKDICKILSNCAKKNEIPVVIAAQLNRQIYGEGIDGVSVANIGEGADIERIAKDIFLVWQVDKTPLTLYAKKSNDKENEDDNVITTAQNLGKRAQRIFKKDENDMGAPIFVLKSGYLYVEHLKARYGETGGWGLLKYDGESGQVDYNDTVKMAE
jgi:replicative DNA helicase